MMRIISALTLVLLFAVFSMFQIKYSVLNLRKDYSELKRQLVTEKDAIHVLNAEWTYLNQPERLKKLATEYLKLEPIKVSQLHKSFNDLPSILAENPKIEDKNSKIIAEDKNTVMPNSVNLVNFKTQAKNKR